MAEMLGAFLMKQINGPPDTPPLPPPRKPLPEPPKMANQPLDPGNVPGKDDKTSSAGEADEKRRILKAMPKATDKEFAGDTGKEAPVKKKRLLGGGTGGNPTTGGAAI